MAKQNKIKSVGQLRIIAGRWRGRKLSFPDVDGLRPTPDRVRETLFNWLQPVIANACCLDLFSGSGALAFEAASRGAVCVTMVECDSQAAKQLQANCQQLSADICMVENTTAQQYLNNCSKQYDVVFVDPPYQADLWTEIAEQLVNQGVLSDNAHLYLECPSKKALPDLPNHWQLIKDKTAGEVRYCLFLNKIGETE